MELFQYHEGELRMQQAMGVLEAAERLSGMVSPEISARAQHFLATVDALALAGKDNSGRMWATLCAGEPGFMRAGERAVFVPYLDPTDPLAQLGPGDPVGMVAIDMANRQRLRINGEIALSDPTGMMVVVEEAYGNCRKYIDSHRHIPASVAADRVTSAGLSDDDVELIEQATTFFIGSSYPEHGADCSHRGGPTGFVEVTSPTSLRFADFSGNNMYNTLGNLLVNPAVGIVIPDNRGRHLQITGAATVKLEEPDPGTRNAFNTGRSVTVQIKQTSRPATGRMLRP